MVRKFLLTTNLVSIERIGFLEFTERSVDFGITDIFTKSVLPGSCLYRIS